MKTITLLSMVLIAITSKSQIPNNGFENWSTMGNYENPLLWNNCNSFSSNMFFPVTKSTDHYPLSLGNYSIRIENKVPHSNCSTFGFAQTSDNFHPCRPAFPITGHPNSFCGYYKSQPMNGDTIQLGLMLFKAGIWVAGAELITTSTVSNWTSFNIPISSYSDADSATITLAAFYNDTTCGTPFGPFGNSVLFVDNLSFDNLITSVSDLNFKYPRFSLSPIPAIDLVNIDIDNEINGEIELNIYTLIGIKVRSEILSENLRQLNIRDFENGIYLIELKSKDWTEKQKLIIQR
jgi:hypothetical protein